VLEQVIFAATVMHERIIRMTLKLTSNLAEQLRKAGASDLLDIILELHPQAESAATAAPGNGSRSEKIAAKKEAFTRSVASVEEAIRKAGGEITGLAWINQTVRARVPAERIRELSEHDKIAALDIPHLIKSDIS
jgi:hypothetical protein